MKVTIASFIMLGILAILGDILDLTHEFRYFYFEIVLIWITGATYARNADAPFKVDIGIGAKIKHWGRFFLLFNLWDIS
jgi:hypothetical protein